MSKRTDTIRSLFTAPQAETLSADNTSNAAPRVASGSVRSLQDSFSTFERENEELRIRLLSGSVVIEVDPSLIDSSPVTDRFAGADDSSFEALKTSIRERGQEIPILIREHPAKLGRYQTAYGHRRVRAARELGRPVRAIIRALSDEDLVVAQGVENSARQDLSFIERAVFAMRLEDAGHERSIVQEALSIDRAEASKLLSVARTVPADVIDAIGRASKVGRGRWQSLADALNTPAALNRIRAAVSEPGFTDRDSDAKFLFILSAATKTETARSNSDTRAIVAPSGVKIARVLQTERELKVAIDRTAQAGFATFLVDQLPDLFNAYLRTNPAENDGEA